MTREDKLKALSKYCQSSSADCGNCAIKKGWDTMHVCSFSLFTGDTCSYTDEEVDFLYKTMNGEPAELLLKNNVASETTKENTSEEASAEGAGEDVALKTTWKPVTATLDGSITDSGVRRVFDTGAKRDMSEGKGRFDLMPLGVVTDLSSWFETDDSKICSEPVLREIEIAYDRNSYWHFIAACSHYIRLRGWTFAEAMLETAKHFEEDAKKYGEYNWQKGIPISSYVDSACRHFFKWQAGQTDERHDRAVIWNLMCGAWTALKAIHVKGIKE